MLRALQVDWQVVLLLAPIGLELLRQGSARAGASTIGCFYLCRRVAASSWTLAVVLLATVLGVATPIKIWNNARIEHRLQEQEKLLLAAKIEALANQINPHFLFNTLTSISSLIRTQPETARMLITKLSGLLRRLMRSTDHFVTLREELESIDEYLDIEVVRFGPQLRVVKQISPDTLDVIVPSMLLQPLVENSIKHGLSRKVGGGRITITQPSCATATRSSKSHDDGLGMTEERLEQALGGGIGLSNVNERLRTIYGASYQLQAHERSRARARAASVEIPGARDARAGDGVNDGPASGAGRRRAAGARRAGLSARTDRRRRGHRPGRQRRRSARRRSTGCSRTWCFSTSRCRG